MRPVKLGRFAKRLIINRNLLNSFTLEQNIFKSWPVKIEKHLDLASNSDYIKPVFRNEGTPPLAQFHFGKPISQTKSSRI